MDRGRLAKSCVKPPNPKLLEHTTSRASRRSGAASCEMSVDEMFVANTSAPSVRPCGPRAGNTPGDCRSSVFDPHGGMGDGTAWLCTQCLTVMSSTDIEKCTNLKCQRKFKVFGCLLNETLRTAGMTSTRYQPPDRRKPSRVAPGSRSAAPASSARNSAPAGGSAAQSSGGRGEMLLLRSLQNHLEERDGHEELTVGWRVVWSVRKGGKSQGTVDVYYIEPGGRRFRSRSEVSR